MTLAALPDDPIYTPDDVATRLRVSRSMAYALIKQGKLRAFYVGRLPRIRASALAAYLTEAEAAR
jgi:excisionase family DNA binding protein